MPDEESFILGDLAALSKAADNDLNPTQCVLGKSEKTSQQYVGTGGSTSIGSDGGLVKALGDLVKEARCEAVTGVTGVDGDATDELLDEVGERSVPDAFRAKNDCSVG